MVALEEGGFENVLRQANLLKSHQNQEIVALDKWFVFYLIRKL